MSKYGEKQYDIDRPNPSVLFLKARDIAGIQIQNQFFKLNKGITVKSNKDGFKWIKHELTYPSFDHLTFAFKNAIFSVVIEIVDNYQTSMTNNQKENLLKAADENNLIACVFKVRINNPQADNPDLIPFNLEWNLFDILTGEEIYPEEIGNDIKTEMSKWELHNFAIQIVRSDIEKNGGKILSFCDVLEVNPQIWFSNKKDEKCWVIVRHVNRKEDGNQLEWVGLERKNENLIPYDGFFAGVQFISIKNDKLYRGDSMNANYVGLKRIYVS